MKKAISILTLATLMIAFIITGCKQKTQNEQNAQENLDSAEVAVENAQENLDEAKRAATAEEWQAFKDETNAKIDENNARIAELKSQMKKTGKDIDQAYQRNIDTIEQRNKRLKTKIDAYKNDANSDWQAFKREFNHDMEELGKSLKGLTENDKN